MSFSMTRSENIHTLIYRVRCIDYEKTKITVKSDVNRGVKLALICL